MKPRPPRPLLLSAERAALELLLGEPLMVTDPLITISQAAVILDISPGQVRALIATGALPIRAGSRVRRRLRLSDVLARTTIAAVQDAGIGVVEAAQLLSEQVGAVRELANAGLLTHRGGHRPYIRREVQDLAARRRNWLTIARAAAHLRCSQGLIRELLDQGILHATGDVSRPVNGSELDAIVDRQAVERRDSRA